MRRGHPEELHTQREAEPTPVSLYRVSLPLHARQAEEGRGAGYIGQPEQRRETRVIRPGAVGGLVRRLMATERARILGRKAIDLGRYSLEKRTQRWRELRKSFK
jgi:hypothetical protein